MLQATLYNIAEMFFDQMIAGNQEQTYILCAHDKLKQSEQILLAPFRFRYGRLEKRHKKNESEKINNKLFQTTKNTWNIDHG